MALMNRKHYDEITKDSTPVHHQDNHPTHSFARLPASATNMMSAYTTVAVFFAHLYSTEALLIAAPRATVRMSSADDRPAPSSTVPTIPAPTKPSSRALSTGITMREEDEMELDTDDMIEVRAARCSCKVIVCTVLTPRLRSSIAQAMLVKFGSNPDPDGKAWSPGEWETCLESLLEADALPKFGLY